MATYTFQIISSAALSFNSGTGELEVVAGYDPDIHSLIVAASDDATDDSGAEQRAVVTDMNGSVVASGPLTSPGSAQVNAPDGAGIFLDRIEVEGALQGYATSAPMAPGTSYRVTSSQATKDDISPGAGPVGEGMAPPGFGPGTQLLTPDGPRALAALQQGDLVLTRDHGAQEIRWIGRAQMGAAEISHSPDLHPVRISPPQSERRALVLSSNHRVLVTSARAELLFGAREVFITAKHVAEAPSSDTGKGIVYSHVLFDRHEVIYANGHWVESMLATPLSVAGLPPVLRTQVLRIAQQSGKPLQTARSCLTSHETHALQMAREVRAA